MSNKALATIENVNGTALEPYRDRDEVRELTTRLLSLHPAASEVGEKGMTAVAQLALMIGASPLPGVNEIHVWTKEVKGQKVVQFQLGINYFRRKALEYGGAIWQTQVRQMDDRERDVYGIHQGQLAAICRAVRVTDMEKWMDKGLTVNQIFDMLGATGTATAGTNEGKHGRPAVWTAFKRAEVDLYRQLFPTMMQQVSQAQIEADVVIETDPGPDWDDLSLEEHEEQVNSDLFASYDPEPVEAEFEDEPEVEETQEINNDQYLDIDDKAMMAMEDIRIDLDDKIKDDKITLGLVYDAAVDTGLYNHWKQCYNAVTNPDTGYDLQGAKAHKKQVLTGKGGLLVFDWLIDRKAEPATEETK